MSHCWYILPPVDMPALLSIHLPCCQYAHPTVDMPASCQYSHLLSICPPCCQSRFPAVDMPALLSIPAVDTPASCWYTCLLSICLPCCRSWFPVVDMPALLSIRPAVNPCCPYRRYAHPAVNMPTSCQYAHLLSIHLHPYWYTCTPIDTPALAVIVVGCGAADESWRGGGRRCPHPSRRGGARNIVEVVMVVNLHGLTWSAYSPVGPWVELAGDGRNNGKYCHTGDKAYFKSQYIEFVTLWEGDNSAVHRIRAEFNSAS